MPDMPDPISRCPIFERLQRISGDPHKVKEALKRLDDGEDFVAVGVALGVIRTDNCYDCGGRNLNEAEYMNQLWFNEWWKSHQPIKRKLTGRLRKALILSRDHTQSHNEPCPIVAIWYCAGDEFDPGVPRKTGAPFAPQVRWMITTPPPDDECVPAPCT